MKSLKKLKKHEYSGATLAFLWGLLIATVIFTPLIIWGHGCFLYMGDYNVQQIAFYKLAHEAVRSGNIFWSWTTDLGANFIGSYSFYLLFSPFFWLTLPFPTSWVPYLMGPIIVLKLASAALTGYIYIKRFVSDKMWAVLGGLLYAFSGHMLFNVFFNHFLEVAVFFPLLLVSLEELVTNNRRVFFATMVALNAMVNYWFFIGEAVFTVLYVIIRISTGGWGCTFKKFCQIAFESILGMLLACAVFIPSVFAIMGNPRTGTDELLTGKLMWIWGWEQRLPAIIQSFFFPPEQPSNPVFFSEMGAKWSSLSAWIPLFSTTGVIAYCRARQHDFGKRIIIASLIISLVPIFNSIFVLFNSSYYARWYYMPILIMSMATAKALEERQSPAFVDGWHSGFRWTGGFIAVFLIAVGLTPVIGDDDTVTFGFYSDGYRFLFIGGTAVLCLILAWVIIFRLKARDTALRRAVCIGFSVVTVAYSIAYIGSGKHNREYDEWYLDTVVNGGDNITLEVDNPFARSDFYECTDNLGMQWGLPNIQCFHSVVPVSIMEFYPKMSVKRDVSSKPGTQYRALRDLLSVRWLFIEEDEENQKPMGDFTYYDTQNGYCIYENDNYIPIGFAYDTAICYDDIEDDEFYAVDMEKQKCLLYELVMTDEAIERNSDILTVEDSLNTEAITDDNYHDAIEKRREMCVDSFTIDKRGFTAETSYEEDTLVFFSVPYDKGWSATVNGEEARIERVDYGFMAVRVPKGESTIRFSYIAPGLLYGIAATCIGVILLCGYIVIGTLRKSKAPATTAVPTDENTPIMAYLEKLEELPSIENEGKKSK